MAREAGGAKTEQPTAKRLRDAKKRGEVARSRELASAVILLAALVVLWLTGGSVGELFLNSVKEQIAFAASFKGDLTPETARDAVWSGLRLFAFALAPLFAALVVAAFLANYLQVGSAFSVAAVKPSFARINPTANFKQQFFNSRAFLELLKTLFKIAAAAIIAAWILSSSVNDLLRLTNQPAAIAVSLAFRLALQTLFAVALAFLAIGVADYFLQQFLHRRALMMTRQEIKDEQRETEGDPLIKSRRRARHREIAAQEDLTVAVTRANVVVTADRTNIAVALRYDREATNAPMIAAKGVDSMAVKISEIARAAKVSVRENESLAQALFALKVGDEIPPESYETVAVILREIDGAREKKAENEKLR